jgi:hypothetical protein
MNTAKLEDGLRVWRIRMCQCDCGVSFDVGIDLTDGSTIEYLRPCPRCGHAPTLEVRDD